MSWPSSNVRQSTTAILKKVVGGPISVRSPVLTWLLLCSVVACGIARAEQGPLPQLLATAKSVYPINASGDLKAYDSFYESLTKWNHFTIAPTRQGADIVAVLTTNAAYTMTFNSASGPTNGGASTSIGSAFSIPPNYLGLKIFDAHTGEVLWTDAADTRGRPAPAVHPGTS